MILAAAIMCSGAALLGGVAVRAFDERIMARMKGSRSLARSDAQFWLSECRKRDHVIAQMRIAEARRVDQCRASLKIARATKAERHAEEEAQARQRIREMTLRLAASRPAPLRPRETIAAEAREARLSKAA